MSNIIFFKKRTLRDESQLLKEETNRFFMEKNLIITDLSIPAF